MPATSQHRVCQTFKRPQKSQSAPDPKLGLVRSSTHPHQRHPPPGTSCTAIGGHWIELQHRTARPLSPLLVLGWTQGALGNMCQGLGLRFSPSRNGVGVAPALLCRSPGDDAQGTEPASPLSASGHKVAPRSWQCAMFPFLYGFHVL